MHSIDTMTDTVTGLPAHVEDVEDVEEAGTLEAAAPAGDEATIDTTEESLRVELGRLLRALGMLAARLGLALRSTGRRGAALIGVGDELWWEPAGRRLLGRARARRLEATLPAADPAADGAPGRARPPLRWGQVLAAGVVAFGVWLLFDAPTLMHNAEGSPLGARRTAAMVVLRPVAALSRDLGLSHVVGAADRVMGRTGGSVVQVVGPPAHRHHHTPPPRSARPVSPATARATDTLPPLPPPSAAAPLRLLSIGDSLGVDFGGPFVDDLAATGVVNAALDAHVDTGLSRPDYFDWPAELQADLARYQPEAVVVFLGANDPQNFVDGGTALAYGSPAWSAAYARRVGQLMQEATSAGARVLWVGMPPMQDPALGAKMQALDAIYQSEAAAHPGVTYLSSWPAFSDGQGNYAQYLPDASGSQVAVREPDGTHISPGGAERLSQDVIAAMDRTWGLSLQP